MKPRTSRTTHARKRPSPQFKSMDAERRRAMVAEAAYYRAEQRGFEPGRELEDWCAAESDVDSLLARGTTPTLCGP